MQGDNEKQGLADSPQAAPNVEEIEFRIRTLAKMRKPDGSVETLYDSGEVTITRDKYDRAKVALNRESPSMVPSAMGGERKSLELIFEKAVDFEHRYLRELATKDEAVFALIQIAGLANVGLMRGKVTLTTGVESPEGVKRISFQEVCDLQAKQIFMQSARIAELEYELAQLKGEAK